MSRIRGAWRRVRRGVEDAFLDPRCTPWRSYLWFPWVVRMHRREPKQAQLLEWGGKVARAETEKSWEDRP